MSNLNNACALQGNRLNGPWKIEKTTNYIGTIIVDRDGGLVCSTDGIDDQDNAIAKVPEMKAALERTNAHLNEIITRIAEGYHHVGTDKTEAIFKANKQLLAEMEG